MRIILPQLQVGAAPPRLQKEFDQLEALSQCLLMVISTQVDEGRIKSGITAVYNRGFAVGWPWVCRGFGVTQPTVYPALTQCIRRPSPGPLTRVST